MGEDCGGVECSRRCMVNGRCGSDGGCVCRRGWNGIFCELSEFGEGGRGVGKRVGEGSGGKGVEGGSGGRE